MKTGEVFCHNLRVIREAQGFTQKSLALKVGLNDQAIREYESGRRFPSVETLGLIASALGVKVSDLFESEGEPQILKLPVSETLKTIASIPDEIYEMALKVGPESSAWETVKTALEVEIEKQQKEAKKKKNA